MIRRLRPLGKRLGALLAARIRRRRQAEGSAGIEDVDAPAQIYQTEAGWEVRTATGLRCHCFTDWYHECRLLPGGHAELTRRQGATRVVYRFRWCGEGRRYHPDHPADNPPA